MTAILRFWDGIRRGVVRNLQSNMACTECVESVSGLRAP